MSEVLDTMVLNDGRVFEARKAIYNAAGLVVGWHYFEVKE